MSPVVPPFNADPAATPFLRWCRERIEELERSAHLREQGEGNANRAQSTTLQRLGTTVQEIRGIQGRLINPVSLEDRTTGFVLSGTLADAATAATVVPDDCTGAIVFVTATGGLRNDDATGWSTARLGVRVASGVAAVASPLISQRFDAGQFGNVVAPLSTKLTSLTPGDALTASVQMSFLGANSLTSAVVSGLVMFVP